MAADQGSHGRTKYVELARKIFQTINKVARWSWRILREAYFAFNLWTVIRQADNQVVHGLAPWLSALFGGKRRVQRSWGSDVTYRD